MATVTGLLETSLYVTDLQRSAAFYQNLFGFTSMLSDDRMIALNIADRQILLLFLRGASDQVTPVPGGVIPPHDSAGRSHVAFSIPADQLPAWQERLTAARVQVESVVHPPRGGTSLYFRDPDGHLVELATPGLWPIY